MLLDKPTVEERVEVCRMHLLKSVEWKNPVVGILEMRRHYANYFKSMDHFKEYRMRLVTSNDLNFILSLLDEIAEKYLVVSV
jgi:tRNA-dihydrouridine synthase